MKCYDIVDLENPQITLARCKSLEFAKKYLKEIKKGDQNLFEFYHWDKLPEYKIIKRSVKNYGMF